MWRWSPGEREAGHIDLGMICIVVVNDPMGVKEINKWEKIWQLRVHWLLWRKQFQFNDKVRKQPIGGLD